MRARLLPLGQRAESCVTQSSKNKFPRRPTVYGRRERGRKRERERKKKRDCDRFVLKRENASFTARRLMILGAERVRSGSIKPRIRNNKWSGSRLEWGLGWSARVCTATQIVRARVRRGEVITSAFATLSRPRRSRKKNEQEKDPFVDCDRELHFFFKFRLWFIASDRREKNSKAVPEDLEK